MWLTCDCNFFVKLISLFILIFAIVVNGIGNFLGLGDLIVTEPHSCYTTTVTEEATTVPSTTEPVTVQPTTTEPHATTAPTEATTAAPTTETTVNTTSATVAPTVTEAPSEVETAAPTTQVPTTHAPTTVITTTEVPTVPGPTFGPPVIVDPTTTPAPTTTEAPTQTPTTQIPTTQEPTTQEPTTQEPTTEPERVYLIPQPQVTVFDDVYSILVVPPVVEGSEITLSIEPEAEYVDYGNGMQGFIGVIPGTTYTITAHGVVDGVEESSKPVVVTVYDPVTPATPVIKSVTHNSITVEYDERCEYRLISAVYGVIADWGDKVHFENLDSEIQHTVEARYKTTETHMSSNEETNRAWVIVKTLPAPATTAAPTTAITTTAAPTTARPTTTRPSTTRRTTVSTTKAPTTEGGPYIDDASEIAIAVFGGNSGNIETVIKGIDATRDGGYITCGTTASTDGDFSGLYHSLYNWQAPFSFVAKFSRAGTVEWIKLYGDPSATVSLYDVAVLGDGNIVAVGVRTVPSNYGSMGGNDAMIIKLSSSGRELSKDYHIGSKDDFFYCVTATPDGYAVGGKTNSDDGAFTGVRDISSIVINFNNNNEVLWKHYFNGSKSSSINGIASDDEGNIFLACVTTATDGQFASFSGLFGSYSDTVIMKFNRYGEYQWNHVIASSGSDEFDSIAADGKGGCVVAGNYTLISTVTPDGTLTGIHNCGDTDAVAFRLNREGKRQWYKIVSGFKADYITDVVRTDGGFALTGYTNSSNREFATIGNKGGTDGFVSFIDVNGTMIGSLSQAGFGNDAALCLAYSGSNHELLVAGKTVSTDGSFEEKNPYTGTVGYVGRYKIALSNF